MGKIYLIMKEIKEMSYNEAVAELEQIPLKG